MSALIFGVVAGVLIVGVTMCVLLTVGPPLLRGAVRAVRRAAPVLTGYRVDRARMAWRGWLADRRHEQMPGHDRFAFDQDWPQLVIYERALKHPAGREPARREVRS